VEELDLVFTHNAGLDRCERCRALNAIHGHEQLGEVFIDGVDGRLKNLGGANGEDTTGPRRVEVEGFDMHVRRAVRAALDAKVDAELLDGARLSPAGEVATAMQLQVERAGGRRRCQAGGGSRLEIG